MEDVLELETRRKIYDIIGKNPGLHLSKIADMLQMRISHVEYHVNYLEKHDIITVEKSTGYKRVYVKGTIGIQDKRYLSVLRQKTLLQIILFLLKSDTVQHKDILENVPVSPSTLSYHLKKLVKHDIIEVQRYGENKGYRLKNREEIVTWLIQYKPFDLYEEFTDVWTDISI
ncbi:MAG: winged helix-turn-helix transcriptional regulator [Candidatus Thermoplasmatota archaeon]|nr:winged helix-turn-helix transcriptional regulator [Candidatus Thermoplasmatota archaeon]